MASLNAQLAHRSTDMGNDFRTNLHNFTCFIKKVPFVFLWTIISLESKVLTTFWQISPQTRIMGQYLFIHQKKFWKSLKIISYFQKSKNMGLVFIREMTSFRKQILRFL